MASAQKSLELAGLAHQNYLIRSSKKDLDEAIEHYINAIKLDPNIPETYYRLASLLLETGQISLESAIEQCKEAIKLSPDNPNAHIYTGYFLSVAQDYEGAQEEFEKAINLDPVGSARARLVLAIMLLEKKPNALEFTKSLYYLFSGALTFFFDGASVKMLADNVKEDFSVFKYKFLARLQKTVKGHSKAFNTYKNAVRETGQEALFYEKMADTSLEREKPEIALDCLRRALDSDRGNAELTVKLVTLLHKYAPENTDELIDLYTRLARFNPEFSRCYYELGHLYIKKDDKLSAVNAFSIAIEKEGDNAFYYNSLAYSYVLLEQYDDAIVCYKKAIDLSPDKIWGAIVCQALGSIYHNVKRNFDAALAVYNNGLMFDRENAELYSNIADVYFDMGDFETCLQFYQSALELDGENPKLYSRIAMAYWEKDIVEKALDYYHAAIDLDPEYEIALNNLGVIYLDGLGDPDTALGYFDEAAEINPEYTLAHFNAGRALEAMGQPTDAAKNYQVALDLNKTSRELDEEDIKARLWGLFEV